MRERACVRVGPDVQRHVMRVQFVDVRVGLLQHERAMHGSGLRRVRKRRQRMRDVRRGESRFVRERWL
jgi:hypothetical protein